MRMKTTARSLWLAAFVATTCVVAAPAQDSQGLLSGGIPQALGRLVGGSSFRLDPSLEAFLKEHGFVAMAPGVIIHRESGMDIPPPLLLRAGMAFGERGTLVYANSGLEVEREHLPGILAGLLRFSSAFSAPAEEVGAALAAWGVPAVYDGRHLLNPDGTATYFGRMLYEGLRGRSQEPLAITGERLSRALDLAGRAFEQGILRSAADIGAADLDRAWDLMAGAREGETPIEARPYAAAALAASRTSVMQALTRSTGREFSAELRESAAVLVQMEEFKYYEDLEIDLTLPPPPPSVPPGPREMPPPAGALPKLLSVLERVNGGPLASEELEALIKSFPMGETVWRMGVQDLWREGLTGKGVKVAVIDTGVAPHPELGDALKSRENFTRQRGADAVGLHGTHVAGTIHALAPDAELRSYKAIEDAGSETTNPRLTLDDEEVMRALAAAVDRAVADGNQVVNMSLGSRGRPAGPLASKIEQYAREGVIFVIAAGNSGAQGVATPSMAESVLTAGALDARDRMAVFSSYGEDFDPAKLSPVIKTVFLAPGTNIVSTRKGGGYMGNAGTSMAAPHIVGAAALLVQGLKQVGGAINPVELSRRLRDALASAGRPLPRRELPADVPPDQEYLIVDPVAAWRKLRASV